MSQRGATPRQLKVVLEEVFSDEWALALASLRVAAHGQNPPVTAQIVHALILTLPRDAAQTPGSREFRTAARDALASRGIPFEPTRLDVRNGVAWLARNGLLPRWVFTAEDFGGHDRAYAR